MKARYYFMLLLTMLTLTNCNDQENLKPEIVQNAYTSEELFKGIMFLEKEMLDRLPETKKMFPNFNQLVNTQQEKKVFAEMKSILIDRIRRENPNFFDSFQKNLQSGNHFLVAQALDDGAEALVNALKSEYAYEALSVEEEEALRQININDFVDSEGNIKEDKLTEFLEKNQVFNQRGLRAGESARGHCFAIALEVVIILNAAVLVTAAIGVALAVAVEAAFGFHLAAAYETALSVPSSGGGGSGSDAKVPVQPHSLPKGSQPLAKEIIINEMATKLSL